MERAGPYDDRQRERDLDTLVIEFQRTGDERALEPLMRWVTQRIRLRVDVTARCTHVSREDLEDEASKVLRPALRGFAPEGKVGFAAFFDQRLRWALYHAADGGGRELMGESRHTGTDRGLVLKAHKSVSAHEASRRNQLRRLVRPPPLTVPPVDLALSEAAAAASTYAARRAFYRTLPSILDALAAYLRGALEAAAVPTSPGAVERLAAWCVVEALKPPLRSWVRADMTGEPRPAPPRGRPGVFARGLGELAQSAWMRYFVWRDSAVTHPMREFWARVADMSGVSPRQAQLLYATQRNVESLEALRSTQSSSGTGSGNRAWADVVAAPDRSDAGVDADEDARARRTRVADAEALYGRLGMYEAMLLVAAYGLEPVGRLRGTRPDLISGYVAMLEGSPSKRARALARGERILGVYLWVLVAASDGPRTVWRRHPALRVLRRAKMQVAEWVAAHASPGDPGSPSTHGGGDLARAQSRRAERAAGGASARGGTPAPIEVQQPPRTYAVAAGDLTRALRRVGLGALGRGRQAAQRPDSSVAPATLSISVAGATCAVPPGIAAPIAGATVWVTLSVLHRAREVSAHTRIAGRLADDAETHPDATAQPPSGPAAGDVDPETSAPRDGGSDRPDVLLGRADARAFAAALRGLPGTAMVRVSGRGGALSVTTNRACVVLRPPLESGPRVHRDAADDDALATLRAAAATGARLRAGSLIRAALRVAPFTTFASDGDRRRRAAWGRADVVATFANGWVTAAVSNGDLLACTAVVEAADTAPAHACSARVPGRVIASLPDVFPPDETLRIARVGGFLCIDGRDTWIRVAAGAPLPADWHPRLTDETLWGSYEVGELVSYLRGVARNSGRGVGDVRCIGPAGPFGGDPTGDPASAQSGVVVSTAALLAALAAIPAAAVGVSTATVGIPRAQHTHEYPAVVVRPLWPARAVAMGPATATPADDAGRGRSGWAGTWIAVAGAAPPEGPESLATLPTIVL